jgi:two-component system OmpR family sensor kinase
MTITWRLILSLTLIIAISWLGAAVITRNVFVDEVDEILADNLQGEATRILHITTHILLEAPESDEVEAPETSDELALLSGPRFDFLAFEVRDAKDKVVLRSPNSEELLSETRTKDGFYVTENALFFALSDPKSRYSITMATASHHRDEAIAEASWALVLPMIGLLVLMAATTALLVRAFLAPLSDLSLQMSKRGGNNLTQLQSDGLPPDLRPIAGSVNLLMQRLQTALDSERVFAANSAHELRTPLAGALAQAQQLRAEIGEGAGSARAAQIESALKKLAHLATRLLQLARADANLGQLQERQNLGPVLNLVVQEFTGRAAAPLKLLVQDSLHQDLLVQMDADAFAIVLRNLIENAEKHGAPDTPITMAIGPDWTISVKNHGTVVAQQDLPALKQRFQRGQSESDGAGLGLAIADKLITQSGGTLTLISPASGYQDGFEGLIKLP